MHLDHLDTDDGAQANAAPSTPAAAEPSKTRSASGKTASQK